MGSPGSYVLLNNTVDQGIVDLPQSSFRNRIAVRLSSSKIPDEAATRILARRRCSARMPTVEETGDHHFEAMDSISGEIGGF